MWTPWQRVEVFNALRQSERTGSIDAGESKLMIRLLEQEVRLGYWPHVEFDWTDAIRTAGELSAEHSLSLPARGMDLFHVAVAIEVGADIFLTFDKDQNTLAVAAGFKVLS
jgi:predicted nucleic acid-binding protein